MRWLRRARPLVGTLVDVGVPDEGNAESAVRAAFAAIAEVQACLSRFDAASDLARFDALACGDCIVVRPDTATVLAAAWELHQASDGLFDISLGSAPDGWRIDGRVLRKVRDATRLDAGGIAKGHAVDRAVLELIERGCACGWVNAGGDVRAFGDFELPLFLRDEARGGARSFATLRDGAFATSHYGNESRCRAAGSHRAHASVAAPLAIWADALTKVVAISADAAHPLLERFGALAWLHA